MPEFTVRARQQKVNCSEGGFLLHILRRDAPLPSVDFRFLARQPRPT